MDKKVFEQKVENTMRLIGKNAYYTRRKVLDCTLKEFSEYTGISRDVICRLEYLAKGKFDVYPSFLTTLKFSYNVGVTMSELYETDFEGNSAIESKIREKYKKYIEDNKQDSKQDNK